MKSMSTKEAKNGFGLLLDTARAGPVMIEKHGRPVVVVLSTEEYERLLNRSGRKKAGKAREVTRKLLDLAARGLRLPLLYQLLGPEALVHRAKKL